MVDNNVILCFEKRKTSTSYFNNPDLIKPVLKVQLLRLEQTSFNARGLVGVSTISENEGSSSGMSSVGMVFKIFRLVYDTLSFIAL